MIPKEIYVIKWEDAYSYKHMLWEHISDIMDEDNSICISVGVIIKETKDNIVVIPHLANVEGEEEGYNCCGMLTIPRSAILKIQKLKVKL